MSTNASAAGAGYDYTGGIIDNNTIQVYSDGLVIENFNV